MLSRRIRLSSSLFLAQLSRSRSTKRSLSSLCWSCGAAVGASQLKCGSSSCGRIQDLSSPEMDSHFFELLSLPRSFDIQKEDLDAAQRRLQRLVHPDLAGDLSPREQEACSYASSRINVAHRTLVKPATRAQYLLKLSGFDALGEGAGTKGVSPELLMQVMDARELISDPDTPREALEQLRSRNLAAIKSIEKDLSSAFLKKNFELAKEITVALQYSSKIEEEITERLDAHVSKEVSR